MGAQVLIRELVLTAARPSEALEARWAEVDFDRRLWTLPAERMKSAKQHVVPLSTAALAVLDRQQRVRSGDAVFPGRSGSPLSYASFATAPAKAGIDACTPHGWRSCFRDWCGDIGDVPRDLAEAALAHSLNATEGAYRRMTAIERRREVMTRYADWLNDERGKVVAFSTSKTASAGADAPGQRAAPLRRGRYAAELYSKPPKIRRHRAGGA